MYGTYKERNSCCHGYGMCVINRNRGFSSIQNFFKKFVDSNQWTTIINAKKDSTSGFCSVTIDDIYDADGNDCDYKKIKAVCYNSKKVAVNKSSYTVTKGKMCIMGYKSGFSVIGKTMTLKAMGNNPSLDCKISGAFNPD